MSSIKDQIRQEIERRKDICQGIFERESDTYYQGKAVAYDEALAFIDSLPDNDSRDESKIASKDLEEEIQGMYQAIFGTDIINRREMVYLETFDMIARHFAEWGTKHSK